MAQQREAIAQAFGHRGNSKRGRARRGEFDGERDTVEVSTDRGKRREFFRA